MENKDKPNEEEGEPHKNKKRASAAALIDAFVNEYRTDREKYNRRESHRVVREWLTIIFLFIAASAGIVQAWIFIGQLHEMERAYGPIKQSADAATAAADAATKSANAAKQGADAVLNVERPYLFAIPRPKTNVQKDGTDSPTDFEITVSVSDLGRVPAVLLSVYRQCAIFENFPDEARYHRRYMRRALNAITAGQTLPIPDSCKIDPLLSTADWVDIRTGKKGVVMILFIIYEGALDFTYVYGAAYMIDPFTGNAYSVGGPSYNYERSHPGRISAGADIPIPNLGE